MKKKRAGKAIKSLISFLGRPLGTGHASGLLSILPEGPQAATRHKDDRQKSDVTVHDVEPSARELSQVFSDLGMSLWRLRRKMLDPLSGAPRKEMAATYAHVEQAFKALAAAGVEVRDHDNTEFDSGLSLKVLDFQEVSGISHEMVIDTVRPTIYYRGEVIQNGVVIVGTPRSLAAETRN